MQIPLITRYHCIYISRSTHHIINMIIRADFPVQGAVELAHHKVPVAFIFHELLETVQFEPTNAFSFKHLIHNLFSKEIQDSISRETAAFIAQHTSWKHNREAMLGNQDVGMSETHIFEEGLILWVGGWSLRALHSLQLFLPWFAGAMTDQRWLLHQTLPAFWKGSEGLSLLLCLGCTCTSRAWHRSHKVGLWADTACTCSGTLCALTKVKNFHLLSHHMYTVVCMRDNGYTILK